IRPRATESGFYFEGVASQILTVLSRLAEARRFPLGLNATCQIVSVWPRRVRASWAVFASHSFTVRSSPDEAMRLPSGLNATLRTPVLCPRNVKASFPDSTYQTVTPPSSDAAAMRLPSRLNATPQPVLLSRRLWTVRPVWASQIFTTLSQPAEAR